MGCAGSKELDDRHNQEPRQLTVFPPNPAEKKESPVKEPREPLQLSVFPANPSERRKSLSLQLSQRFSAIAGVFTPGPDVPLQSPGGAEPLDDNPNGLTRQDSPETFTANQRALQKPKQDDGIVTVWECEDCPHSPHAASTTSEPRARASLGRAHGIWQSSNGSEGSLPGTCYSVIDSSEEDSRGSTLVCNRSDSAKARAAALVALAGNASTSARASPSNANGSFEDSLGALDPAAQPAAGPAAGGGVNKSRFPPLSEMVLDLSDDEDDDIDASAPGFDMQRWKRYYNWNKTKHRELLRFLWKRFDPETWSVYCMTYKHQDALIDAFQGENVIHGLACRLEQLMSDTRPLGPAKLPMSEQFFAVFVTLTDKETCLHKVVGVVIAHGKSDIPSCLYGLHELSSDWSVLAADVNDPLVRTFVSNLLTAQPPSAEFDVCSKREVL